MVQYSSNYRHRPRNKRRRTLLPLCPHVPSILIIARAPGSRRLLNKLPEGTDLTLDSVVLGNNALKCTYFVDVARKGGLGIVELGLKLCENGCGG